MTDSIRLDGQAYLMPGAYLAGAMNSDLRLAVLDGTGTLTGSGVPAGLPAMTGCTGAAVHRTARAIPAGKTAVLLVLGRNLARCADWLMTLQRAGKTVIIILAESGGMPISRLIRAPASLRHFFEICRSADAAVATSTESQEALRGAGAREVEFIPAPCPVDDPRWDFSVSPEHRQGIFVGTSNFSTYDDNHAAALLSLRDLAAEASVPVTVAGPARFSDRWTMRQMLHRWPAGQLKMISGRLPAEQVMRHMATHRLVFQLEWAGGVGQVAAEALLCRIPCVGGHGAIERAAFPDLCGFGRTTDELVHLAARLVSDQEAACAAVDRARALAAAHLSPAEARSRLASLVDRADMHAGMRG